MPYNPLCVMETVEERLGTLVVTRMHSLFASVHNSRVWIQPATMSNATRSTVPVARSNSTQSIQSPRPSQSSSANQASASNANNAADYVYFERTTTGFSDDAVPRAKTAQLKLEHYYKVAVDAAIERNTRFVIYATFRSEYWLACLWKACWTWT